MQGDYGDEDQVGEEGQGSGQEEEMVNEDADGFGRRRLKQWFGGANPAEFTPAENPEDAVTALPLIPKPHHTLGENPLKNIVAALHCMLIAVFTTQKPLKNVVDALPCLLIAKFAPAQTTQEWGVCVTLHAGR